MVGHVLDIDRFPATALAVRTGQPMAIASLDDPHLTDEEREDMAEYGYESELCIPLLGGDRVIGLIDVFDTRPRDYGEYLDFLRSVGQTAAGAIENAVLLDKLERRNAALAELVELGRTASNAGGLSELVRSVGPRVVELMEADGCQVFILRGDTLHCVLTYDDGRVPRRLRRSHARPRPLPQHQSGDRGEVGADHREPRRSPPQRLRARALPRVGIAERDLCAARAGGPGGRPAGRLRPPAARLRGAP